MHGHRQATVHAVASHSGVVVLQLKRYHSEASRTHKDTRPVLTQPGAQVAVPIIERSDSN